MEGPINFKMFSPPTNPAEVDSSYLPLPPLHLRVGTIEERLENHTPFTQMFVLRGRSLWEL